MRVLSAAEQLRVWERGGRQTPARRSLLLLAAATPELPLDELAQLSVGERDGRLLTLREWTFGAQIESVAACPQCGEQLELLFETADIRAGDAAENVASGAAQRLKIDGYEMRFRPPNSLDLEAIAGCRDEAAARETILARCVLEIKDSGKKSEQKSVAEKNVADLPPKVIAALVGKIAEIDPQANVQLSLICPACQHRWSAAFDIAAFLWSEINDWAERTLREVHRLASAYGWSETDILEMSAARRGFYLELINGA